MEIISTENAPMPLGHYSQAIKYNDLIFISGQLPINQEGDVPKTIEEQTQITLENMQAILIAAGTQLEGVLKTTIYITDIALWGQVNTIYANFFKNHKPARAAVPVKELPKDCLIEIEAVATIMPLKT